MMACAQQDLPMIKLLLKFGANPLQQNNSGKDSFSYTARNPEIIDTLKTLSGLDAPKW